MVEGRGGQVLEGHWGGGWRGWNNRKGSSGSKGDAVGEGECRVTRGDTGWREEEGWESWRKEASRAWEGGVAGGVIRRDAQGLGQGLRDCGRLHLYLLTCPQEGPSSPGPPRTRVSWSPGWRALASHKAPVFPFHFGSNFSRRWGIVLGNTLQESLGPGETGLEMLEGERPAPWGRGGTQEKRPPTTPDVLVWKSP